MEIRPYGRPFYEINFIGRKWNFRLALEQIAMWRNFEHVFNFTWGSRRAS